MAKALTEGRYPGRTAGIDLDYDAALDEMAKINADRRKQAMREVYGKGRLDRGLIVTTAPVKKKLA
ncbi:MAG: hypothetical protein AAB573_02420 [Patescibacteria group bacterium]